MYKDIKVFDKTTYVSLEKHKQKKKRD